MDVEETARLVIDALREAGSSMGAPAFDAAVAYTVAWATVGAWAGAVVLTVGVLLGLLLFWCEDEEDDGGCIVAGMVCLLLGGFVGGIPLTKCLPAVLAPEGYLVMDLVTKITQ